MTMTNHNDLMEVRSYSALIAAFRARADEMEITRETVDAAGGLPSGYTGKLLGAAHVKYLGPMSLGAILGILQLKLIVAPDRRVPITALPRRERARSKRKAA